MEPPRNEKVGQDHEHNQPDEAVNEDVGKVPHPTIERGKEGEENVVEREPLRSGQVLRLLIVNQVGRDGMNPLHYHMDGYGSINKQKNKWIGGIQQAGTTSVWGIPYDASHVLKIDTSQDYAYIPFSVESVSPSRSKCRC